MRAQSVPSIGVPLPGTGEKVGGMFVDSTEVALPAATGEAKGVYDVCRVGKLVEDGRGV